MKARSQARRVAMRCLFQISLVKADLEEALEYLKTEEELADSVISFARELSKGAVEHLEAIDQKIQSHLSKGWDLSRIGNVELAILRLATHELLHRADIPPKVAINEAIELGKEFTTSQSVRFINGVLDAMRRGLQDKKKTGNPAQEPRKEGTQEKSKEEKEN